MRSILGRGASVRLVAATIYLGLLLKVLMFLIEALNLIVFNKAQARKCQ